MMLAVLALTSLLTFGDDPAKSAPSKKPPADSASTSSPSALSATQAPWWRVLPPGQTPRDARLTTVRTLDDYHPWEPITRMDQVEGWRERLRTKMLVGLGLHPMPPRQPIRATIHSSIDKVEYTIEKVFFETLPGHYVTGNLYRPTKGPAKRPVVLCPHGHWPEGRFYTAGEKEIEQEFKSGAERFHDGAKHPLQARMAGLARMGCTVFHYDMIGYADSKAMIHRPTLLGVEDLLRLHSITGLQTFNSIRALDFVLGLPEADPTRVMVTGASGGGTQTFLLAAIDDRVTVAFPCVMVSTAMQGGCSCENAPLLRVGSGNIEFAAMFAPKPLGLTAADDWTKDMGTKGIPELKLHYAMYRLPGHLLEKPYRPFPHNYNQVSREMMYAWANRFLGLNVADTTEKPFDSVPPKQLAVFDEKHPRPKNEKNEADLRKAWTELDERARIEREPRDAVSFDAWNHLMTGAVRSMIVDRLPRADEIEGLQIESPARHPDGLMWRIRLHRKEVRPYFPEDDVPVAVFEPAAGTPIRRTLLWVHEQGHRGLVDDVTGRVRPEVRTLLMAGVRVVSPNVFLTGEYATAAPPAMQPKKLSFNTGMFFFGYNRSVVANRAHDILTAAAWARGLPVSPGPGQPSAAPKRIEALAIGQAGPWLGVALGASDDVFERVAIDLNGFTFQSVKAFEDPMALPGALKYGDLPSLVGVGPRRDLLVGGWVVANHGPAALFVRRLSARGPDVRPTKVVTDRGAEFQARAIAWLTEAAPTR
jgi:hypothetical protein